MPLDLNFYNGQKVGNYTIESHLGNGSIGEVYLATDNANGESTAIKTLGKELYASLDLNKIKQQFKTEFRTASLCTHRNIISVYQYFEFNDLPCLVMEYINSMELKGYIESKQNILIDDVVLIAQQLLAAASHMHGLGIIHRDIKPSNVQLVDEKRIKLSDFGIAIIQSDGDKSNPNEFMSEQNGIDYQLRCGTLSYMSPEQLAKKPIDYHSDLYTIGLIIYELFLMTKEAAQANSKLNLDRLAPKGFEIRDEKSESLTETLIKWMPNEFYKTLVRALNPVAQNRFRSAKEFSQELNRSYRQYLVRNEVVLNEAVLTPYIKQHEVFKKSHGHNFADFKKISELLVSNLTLYNGPIGAAMVGHYLSSFDDNLHSFISFLAEKVPSSDRQNFIDSIVSDISNIFPQDIAQSLLEAKLNTVSEAAENLVSARPADYNPELKDKSYCSVGESTHA